jgi:HYR domain/Secretion system C-terminal sorting domain/Immunoglobulin I-set domain
MTKKSRLPILGVILSIVFIFFTTLSSKSQTTLVAGDIAFTGYISNDPSLPDQFSFVLLKNVTSGTVIKFTDFGWRTDLNAFNSGTNQESEITYTTTAALVAGTEITIAGASATLVGGASAGTMVYSTGGSFAAGNISFPTSGDQIFAYQGSFAAPTFITGLHMNVQTTGGGANNTDAATWDGVLSGIFLNGNTSSKPTSLTTGTNAFWFGTTGDLTSEEDNAKFNCVTPLTPLASLLTTLYTNANWTTNDGPSAGFTLPTGCNYLGVLSAPSIVTQPSSVTICAGTNTSFTITATGAASYQWQVDAGAGFNNITNNATYAGATTTTLTITAATNSLNTYQYRCVATNGVGSTNSNAATLTVTPLPINPTLLAKTPAIGTVADGTPVSATFNAGSGGTGCTDDYRYTTNGGVSYLPYTPGSNISTTGLAAAGGTVSIEGRRASCASLCQGTYIVLASWIVTPLPAGATTLNAGDIGFTGYAATSPGNDFSFVLLRNIGPGTTINFTDNGWLSTNVFGTGETTITWTSNAAYSAGTEVKISGTTATLASGGSAGTVTGTALALSPAGDQILAYRGSAASPTFISAIHMNVIATTTAAAWDGTTVAATASALPTGLTTGTNCIWIGIPGDITSEFSNSRYGNCAGPATLGPIATLRAALNNQANWISDNNTPPDFTLPTGCPYLGVGTPPNITGQPANVSVCESSNTSFTIVASGATIYQWQVNPGTGFVNVTNNATYSGATTATLNITASPFSINNTQYRCIATNGTGSTTSNSTSLTLTPLAIAPTLLAKTPASATVADGTPVSATFNPGSGGAICTDDFRYTTDGGITYLPYTPGSNISTTGVAAGSGFVFIEGRRAGCSGILACDAAYRVLASWRVTPDPAGATTLNAGDIAFSGYISTNTPDEFSFVLLKNIGPGTVINFTDNGWLSTNVFATGEQTVTWTAPASGLPGGTEIKIAGTTATRTGGGAAGTVTGTALVLGNSGDQILAYRGTTATPTFISAIHMNVETTTTAAAWDGALTGTNHSALPTGLTTGLNAIWIGTTGNPATEFSNSRYGNCTNFGVLGSLTGLRSALNNQTNWISDNNTPASITLPAGCNFLSVLVPSISVTGIPLSAFASCAGTASSEQTFTVFGNALTTNIIITAPTDFEISTTSGSGFASSLSLTPSGGTVAGTIIYVRMAASATGTPSGNITVASAVVTTINIAVSGTVNPAPPTPTITAGGPVTFCVGGSVVLTSSSATSYLWSTGETTQSITVTTAGTYTVTVTVTGCTSAPSAGTTVTVNPIPPTPTITLGGPTSFCIGSNVVLTSSSATGNLWSTGETTQSITVNTAGTYTVTVTASGCPSAPSAGITVTVNPLPSTANAGPDATACVSPGSFTMAANVPAVGTGVWSQVPGGPATAIIFTTGSATSNIGGLTTAGAYTFVWTISNGACPPSRDTMTITVNTNPAPFTLTGGGTFCPGTTTLTGPVDPNYTYTWQRSLTGIANPNSFTAFGGTTSIQAVTASGNYRLVVTNQFGCSTSDTIPVSMADYVFNGSLAAGDAQQTGRLNRFAVVSTCAAPKACPGTFTTTGARLYDSYTITNPRNVPVCATIGIASGCGVNMFSVAYSGSFDPNAPCTNYLADPGSSFPNAGYYEATIPANSSIVVVVHEVNTGAGCASYQLTVDVPKETGVTVNPNTPICSATPVTLTAPLASSYSWNPGGNTTQGITVSPTATTKYFVTLGYGNAGCNTVDSAEVVVNQLPTTALAGNDTATCGLTINNLAANTALIGIGTWTQVAGPGTVSFGNANTPNSSATATANGVYTLRWTITTGGACPNSSQDDVQVNFVNNPSTAIAGTDKTACVSPGTAAMTATAPVTGTGVWTQVAGPTTAVIVNAASPTTNMNNLTGTGTYTFRWTVTNAPCPASFDDVDVVVNGNPVPFILAGGGTFCPGTTTLTGPANPNYTYTWERSLSGIANPNSFTSFGGTAQTQAVTSSGNYRLIVTNQFGCTANDTASVSMADYVFNGSLTTGDLQQNGRINRFGVVSTCAAPKACPGTFTTTGARLYDAYTITNPRNVPVCATIGIASGCGVNMFSVAYSGSYDPNALCTNYLADPGSSFPNTGYYEATIPANSSIVVIVHEVNTGTGCANYQLTVDVPRDGAPIVVNPPSVTCASTATLTAPVANSYLWTPGGATTRSFTTAPLFVDTKYTVTLGYGNVGCTRLDSTTVTVTSLPPTISCPTNIAQNNITGQCGRVVTYTTTSGGLPAPALSYTFTGATTASGAGNGSGSFFNVGITTVTVTATNACGSVNCSFTVTITDNQPPTVTSGTIGSCYPTMAAAQAAALAATSATDNCPGALTETASTVGTCSAVVTVRTTDAAGNFTDVTYNTRIDNTAPTVTVGTIGSCYPTVAAAQAAALSATSATDNCPGALTEVASTVGTCSAVITVTTTDGCGNATAVTYNTRIDNTAPTVTVGTIASCYPTAAAAEAAALAATSATDNCPGALTEVASSVGTCSAVITVTTTDGCGNATAITYNTRIDNTAPTVTVGTIASCYPTVAAAQAAALAATNATDNCPGALTEVASTVGTCSAVVTITTTDGCGNATAVTYNTRIDNTAPTVTVGTIASCYPTAAAAEAAAIAATGATDNCPGALIKTASTIGTCSAVVTVTTTDGCGNATTVTYTTRVDNIPPTITCSGPITVSCISEVPVPNFNSLTGVSDNCGGTVVNGGITLLHVGDVITGQTCANRYTITRTYRATDVCGNAAECSQVITVNDQTPPMLTCPSDITVSCTNLVPAPNPSAVTAVSDNCAGAVVVTHQGDVIIDQTCVNRYTIKRTYRATDVCGNFTECIQNIVVFDQIAPTFINPTTVTVSCAGQVPVPNIAVVTGLADNCGGPVTVTYIGDVINGQSCANRYTISRTYLVTDACGNAANCNQIIIVNDQTPPTLICPASITVSCASQVPAANINLVTGVSDNCGGPVSVIHVDDVISNQTCASRYTITRTYRATDVCGNFTNCTQIITVNDQIPPTLTCPAPITVSCVGQVPAPNIAAVTAVSDNCGGAVTVTYIGDVISNQTCDNKYTITRTYRATDACGNFAQCTQIITVNDQTPPTLICPAPVTVSCTSQVPVPNIAAVTGLTDNCGGVITVTFVSDVISNQICANKYTITRTYRATDVCGNFAQCTQIITVNDITGPVITCPANITATSPVGSCVATVNFNVSAVDNCTGAVTITSVPASGSAFPVGTTTVTSTATDACGNTATCNFTVTVLDGQLPVATTQPINKAACVGDSVRFSVVATNTLGYQWQRKAVGTTSWVNVAGATNTFYTIPVTTTGMNNDSFRVVLRGLCSTVFSNAVLLTINALPNVSVNGSPTLWITPTTTTNLVASTFPSGGSFVWFFNNTIVPGVTTSILGPLNIDKIGIYKVTYTDPNGCVSTVGNYKVDGEPSVKIWVYPNPNQGSFQVRFYNAENEKVSVRVLDALGQVVFKKEVQTSNAYSRIDVDIRNLASGIYIVDVINAKNKKLASTRVVMKP